MNVSFRTIRRSGDKLYVLSEISGYDAGLSVVLSASTETGAHIPTDAFPYCDIDDTLALQQVLSDGSLANHDLQFTLPHTKNSAGVRFFVVVLPWMDIRRWDLEFQAIDAQGDVIDACKKSLDARTTALMSMAGRTTNPEAGQLIEQLDGRYIHDRIHVRFLRAQEMDERVLVSALVELPYHDESEITFDFLDYYGQPLPIEPYIVEDSITHAVDYGMFERRFIVVSFYVDYARPQTCVCVTDEAGVVAPGFAMLGTHTLGNLLLDFSDRTTSAYADPTYHDWFMNHHRADVPVLLQQMASRFDYAPLFSVVCILAETPTHHVHDLINSLMQQSYGRWELILVNVGGADSELSDMVDSFGGERIFLMELDPSLSPEENFRAGTAAAEGDFVALMHASDKLAPDALFECVRLINEFPDCDVVYTDVDTISADGVHSHPVFRPDFSPELLRACNYIRDFVVLRASLLFEVGPFSYNLLPAADYDLALRATESARRVCHVRRIACHRRLATLVDDADITAEQHEAGRKALVDHCRRVGINAEVMASDVAPSQYRVRHVLVDHPHVVIVVPSEDNAELLRSCVQSIYSKIHYRDFEVLVVDVASVNDETHACFRELEQRYETLSVVRWEEEFNRAKIANFAAERTEGDFLLFLNDDTRIITEDALDILLGYFQSPEVGVVGPKQLFIDGTVEHAGIVIGGSRTITPLFRYLPADAGGYLNRGLVAQNVTAVTGDCMMVRRSVLESVGGFTSDFSLSYSDVDFCLKAREQGFFTVFTPHVCLSHFHSVSRIRNYSKRIRTELKREAALLQSYWPKYFVEGDSFYNENLDPDSSYFALNR